MPARLAPAVPRTTAAALQPSIPLEIHMKKSLLALSAVVATLFTAQAALAQSTRAEVKAEAASAVKSGAVAKGEGPAAGAAAKSTKERAAVKTEAAAAVKSGAVEKGPSADAGKDAKSTKARAEVKKEAAAAVKAGDVGKGPDVKK
ncbi:MAG: hypothetical protein V4795_10350 [Pseudomonadota bacterium]